MKNLKKMKKIRAFSIDEIQTSRIRKGVLVLANQHFIFFTIHINGYNLDERERAIEIEEKVKATYEKYSPQKYILKTISMKKVEAVEEILVILLRISLVEDFLDSCMMESIVVEAVYPNFLLEYFSDSSGKREFIDFYQGNLCVFSFDNNRLTDVETIDFPLEELVEDSSYIKEYIDFTSEIITYASNYDKVLLDNFEFIELKDWKDYSISYKEELDFAPLKHKLDLKWKKTVKKLSTCTFSIVIIFFIASLFLQNFTTNYRKKTIALDNNIIELNESLDEKANEKFSLEDQIEKLSQEKEGENFRKINEWIKASLDSVDNFIVLKSFEFTGDENFYILGISSSDISYYNFQKLLKEKLNCKNVRHDFFKEKNGEYIFRIEVEL